MESVLLFHNAQMPVAGIPGLNRYRLHLDNACSEVPGMKEFRQNKCILHTPDCRLLHNEAAKDFIGVISLRNFIRAIISVSLYPHFTQYAMLSSLSYQILKSIDVICLDDEQYSVENRYRDFIHHKLNFYIYTVCKNNRKVL